MPYYPNNIWHLGDIVNYCPVKGEPDHALTLAELRRRPFSRAAGLYGAAHAFFLDSRAARA
jgi:hypothetical protein